MVTFSKGFIGLDLQFNQQYNTPTLNATREFFFFIIAWTAAIKQTALFKIFTFKRKHYLYTNQTALVKANRQTTPIITHGRNR